MFVAELGNNSVSIVDLAARHVLGRLTGLDEPQGIAFEPTTNTFYVANGGDGSLRLYDGADFSQVGRINLGADADNVRVDPQTHRVYVGYGSGAIAVIDASTRKKIADIPLRGHPESFQLDPATPRIFVNVPTMNTIEVLSRESPPADSRWLTRDSHANFPMSIDEPNHRLLVGFRQPARLQSIDMQTGKPLGFTDTCGDADDIFVDTRRKWVHVICGNGFVDTYSMSGETFERIARLNTTVGSRTGLLLPELDRLVVAVRATNKRPASIWILRPGR